MSIGFSSNDHILTVYAFLGSATFAALFFILQSKDILQNYELFVILISMSSILFLLAVVGRLNISNGRIKSGTAYALVVGIFAVSGLGLILLIIVMLVAQINFTVGIIVGIFTFTLFLILDILARKSH